MQGFEVRKMTLQEEIENLNIEQEVKDRLLRKLEEMKAQFDRILWEETHEKPEIKSAMEADKQNKMREQIDSLKTACLALANAVNQECKY